MATRMTRMGRILADFLMDLDVVGFHRWLYNSNADDADGADFRGFFCFRYCWFH
jgi:hypothetical protein